jgi:D-serine deaminase-like pyridoxal phosphate-dependent protein
LAFCCATMREMEGMAAAGLGDDLLLANETLAAQRLGALVGSATARVTVAVDSNETVDVAIAAAHRGPLAVLIDVNVGLPRCGCRPEDAGALADRARAGGLEVRGVMGYEGHVVGNPDRTWRTDQVSQSMAMLRAAHDAVGGEIVSAGGTGTYDLHEWANEVQAGSYLLMDTHYQQLGLPFRQALFVEATVISVNDEWAVADAGLKSFGMDHGAPTVLGRELFFSSDEHTTFGFGDLPSPAIGDRVRMVTAHVDPTVAYHERMYVVAHDEVVDEWPVDLRNW